MLKYQGEGMKGLALAVGAFRVPCFDLRWGNGSLYCRIDSLWER